MGSWPQRFGIATSNSAGTHAPTNRPPLYSRLALVLTTIFLLPLIPDIAHSEVDRIALVLAVEEYQHFTSSTVTADTGQKIGDVLKRRGFDVTVVKNPSDATARASLRDFAQKATGANAAIVVLSGHGVSYGGRSYFLPSNSEIARDSDLLSRGLAIPSVAGIVSRAKFGGVFFFMTVANLPSTMQSVSARPSFPSSLEKNVVVVFSTSDKIPVTRVDRVTQQAATDFIDAINANPLTATSLVHAGLAGGLGQEQGAVPDLDLSKAPLPPPTATAAKDGAVSAEAERRAREAEERARQVEARAKEAEERARTQTQEAEARAREAEARASEAEQKAQAKAQPIDGAPSIEAEKRAREAEERAKEAEERARAQTQAAEARVREAEARASEAEQKAQAKAQPAATEAPAAPPAAPSPSPDVKSLTIVEDLFSNEHRMHIQTELKKRDLYKGEIDAIFGPLTREAIRQYQKSLGDEVTGYLTPQQLQSLLGTAQMN